MCFFFVTIFVLSGVTSTHVDPGNLSNKPRHTADDLAHEVELYQQDSQSQMNMCSPCLGVLNGMVGSEVGGIGASLEHLQSSLTQVWENLHRSLSKNKLCMIYAL